MAPWVFCLWSIRPLLQYIFEIVLPSRKGCNRKEWDVMEEQQAASGASRVFLKNLWE